MLKIFVLVFVFTFLKCAVTHQNTLELLHIIFRHGDRTPDKVLLYPKDPYLNATFSPVGYGQVTNAGKLKLYKLGDILRRRYETFLEPYSVETVDARSTDYSRTKTSLQIVLASLFPPKNDLVWNKKLKWQPIPTSYVIYKNDHILGNALHNCPKFRKLYFDFLNSTEGLKLYENFTEVRKYIKKHTGLDPTPKNLHELYFTLQMEAEYGYKLPNWTKSVYPEPMDKLVFLEYDARSSNAEMKKLASGFLLKKIIQDTNQKIKNKLPENRKLFLYSGHEFIITYLLQTLGVFYPHIPPYASFILVEIHNVKGVRNVRIFYQDYKEEKPKRMKLPHCANFCSFKRFVKLYKQFLPRSEKDCNL